jgi:hypothetical protein
MQNTERRDRLSRGLRALAEADDHKGASAAVRSRLLAEVGAIRRARRRATAKGWAIAAGLLLAVALPVVEVARHAPAPPGIDEFTTEFFPLRYSTVPVRGGHVVRMEVPEAAMASFGVAPMGAPIGADPMATVMADIIIGDDGLARAVRFVLDSPQEDQQ